MKTRLVSLAGGVALVAALWMPASAPADRGTFVAGGLTLDAFENQLSVSAHRHASGNVTGHMVFESGISGVHGQSRTRIRIRVTCLEVTGSVAFVGGTTVGATASVGTIHPQYGFVLEDRGQGSRDRWTAFALFATDPSNPCLDLFGPAALTAVRGNIVVMGS